MKHYITILSYIIGIPLTLFIIWLLFVVVILTDPGNPYNL